MALSSGTHTMGGRPRSDVSKPAPRFGLTPKGEGLYDVVDSFDQSVWLEDASFAQAEMVRVQLQRQWNEGLS